MAKPKAEITGGNKAHAKYSASGSERWLRCPGSILASAGIPPLPDTKYSVEGTLAHECLERVLRGEAFALPQFDDEMIAHALEAARIIEGLAGPGTELLCETKVDASSFTAPGQFGTVDSAIVEHFGKLTVIDYKYGAGQAVDPYTAEGGANTQLVYYALGISEKYHHDFDQVELMVIQPRAWHPSGQTVRSHVMSIEELLSYIPVFKNGVKLCEAPKPVRAAGKWCKYCPAAARCPEMRQQAMKKADVKWSDVSGVVSLPEPRLVKGPSIGTMLAACDQLETWIASVRAEALRTLERGGEVPGYKLVAKRGTRKWNDAQRAATRAKQKYGGIAFTTPKLLPPAQFEKVVPGGKRFVEAETCTESSGKTMVPTNDKRTALNAFATFTPIED